jgi:S-DNA-T family DNA segregation ATPase FtsK/SpoIIIE
MGRRHLDGEVSDRGPVEVGRRSLSLSVKAQIGLWVLGALGSLIRVLVTHPVGLAVVASAVVWFRGGLPLVGVWNGALLALMGCWLFLDHESYTRRVTQRLRGWWRGRAVYRPGWEDVLSSSKVRLSEKAGTRAGVVLPKLRHIRSTKGRDVLRVSMLPGQVLRDWVEVCDRLAVAFHCREDSARIGSVAAWRPSWWSARLPFPGRITPREIQLSFLHEDPLADLVEAHPPAEAPNLKALPIARREDGSWHRLRLLGQHLFIAGATGAGKGSVLWSIITQLSGGVRSGLVELVGLDPKGGVELGMGVHLFKRFCRGELDAAGNITSVEASFAEVLEHYVGVMRQRQERMFSRYRLHKPITDEPYIVIVIDEMAALVAKAYQTDPEAGKRLVAAINILLSQGRAMGITIIGAVQDPRKESVPMRGLFTTRIALRLNEEADVDLVLGDGARARGAWCDRIRSDRPGTAYAIDESDPDPIRMRFPFTSDDEIQHLPAAPGRLRTAPEAADASAPDWLPDVFKDGDAA